MMHRSNIFTQRSEHRTNRNRGEECDDRGERSAAQCPEGPRSHDERGEKRSAEPRPRARWSGVCGILWSDHSHCDEREQECVRVDNTAHESGLEIIEQEEERVEYEKDDRQLTREQTRKLPVAEFLYRVHRHQGPTQSGSRSAVTVNDRTRIGRSTETPGAEKMTR